MADASVKSGKCTDCRKAMDDDDDMYCGSCSKGKASALDAQVVALTGKSNPIEAIGVLTAWKQSHEEANALREKVAKQEQAAEALAFDAEIATAKSMGLLAVSDDHKRNKAALAFKGKPGAIDSLRSFLAAFDPLSAPQAAQAAVEKVAEQKPAAPVSAGWSADHMAAFAEIAARTGRAIDPQKVAAHRSALLKHMHLNSEEK